ncbi:DENN (AEX3) domain containing protein [Balamuthia mandrillaris]
MSGSGSLSHSKAYSPWKRGSAVMGSSSSTSSYLREFLWGYRSDEGSHIEIDPEAMTQQERMSRMLHTPRQTQPLPRGGSLFEHFVVVGLPDPNAERPEIIFEYPASNPVQIPGLAEFCFPAGPQKKVLKKTASNSNLFKIFYNQSHVNHPERSYVFLLTTTVKELLYGICVVNIESIEHKPSFILPKEGETKPTVEGLSAVAPRCYCFVSRFPFFQLHFDVLYAILDLEYMNNVSRMDGIAFSLSLDKLKEDEDGKDKKKDKKKRIIKKPKDLKIKSESDVSVSGFSEAPFPGIPLHTNTAYPRPGSTSMVQLLNEPNSMEDSVLGSRRQSLPSPRNRTSSKESSPRLTITNIDDAHSASSVNGEETQHLPSHSVDASPTGDQSPHDEQPPANTAIDTHQSKISIEPKAKEKEKEERGNNDEEASEKKGNTEDQSSNVRDDGVSMTTQTKSNGAGSTSEIDKTKLSDSSTEKHKTNKIVRLLHTYSNHDIPKPNTMMTLPVCKGMRSIFFHRPVFNAEEELLAEWGLPLTFHLLSTDTLLALITACLLERKVIVHSDNLRFLSAVILAVSPLIRPFVYQSVMIPLLPQTLWEFVEAPVPYILGITEALPPDRCPKDAIVFDLNNDKITARDMPPPLPLLKEFRKKFKPYQKAIAKHFSKVTKGPIPYSVNREQYAVCKSVSLLFQQHFSSLFSSFRKHCLCDQTDSEKPITVFLKESFLCDQPRQCRPFMKRFLETQTFFQYCDQRLRKLDNDDSPGYQTL